MNRVGFRDEDELVLATVRRRPSTRSLQQHSKGKIAEPRGQTKVMIEIGSTPVRQSRITGFGKCPHRDYQTAGIVDEGIDSVIVVFPARWPMGAVNAWGTGMNLRSALEKPPVFRAELVRIVGGFFLTMTVVPKMCEHTGRSQRAISRRHAGLARHSPKRSEKRVSRWEPPMVRAGDRNPPMRKCPGLSTHVCHCPSVQYPLGESNPCRRTENPMS